MQPPLPSHAIFQKVKCVDPIFDVAKVSGNRIFMSSKWWKVGWLNIRSKQSCDKVAMGVLLTPRAHCYRILLLGLSQNWAQFSHRKPPPTINMRTAWALQPGVACSQFLIGGFFSTSFSASFLNSCQPAHFGFGNFGLLGIYLNIICITWPLLPERLSLHSAGTWCCLFHNKNSF